MDAIEPNWQALLVYLVAWFIGCVGIIYLSGNLPVRAAPETVQGGIGPALIWVNVAVLVAVVAQTLTYGIGELRWTSLVVGGGFVFLFAPFIVQDLPRGLKDTKAGLVVLLGCLLATAGLVYIVG